MRVNAAMLAISIAVLASCGKQDSPTTSAPASPTKPAPPPVLAAPLDPATKAECDRLLAEAATIIIDEQPTLDRQVEHIRTIKRRLRNRPDWQRMLRYAQLANDRLGLAPYEQAALPGPSWHAVPASLLGNASGAIPRALKLAKLGRVDLLKKLVEDERKLYAEGIPYVDDNLATVDAWLAENHL